MVRAELKEAACVVADLEGRLTQARSSVACLHSRIRALTRKDYARRWVQEDGVVVACAGSDADASGSDGSVAQSWPHPRPLASRRFRRRSPARGSAWKRRAASSASRPRAILA